MDDVFNHHCVYIATVGCFIAMLCDGGRKLIFDICIRGIPNYYSKSSLGSEEDLRKGLTFCISRATRATLM
jgi:hypothetical protein